MKRTASLTPIPKRCQLITARSVDWLIVVLVPAWLMVAWPATTCPPVGAPHAPPENASITLSAIPLCACPGRHSHSEARLSHIAMKGL